MCKFVSKRALLGPKEKERCERVQSLLSQPLNVSLFILGRRHETLCRDWTGFREGSEGSMVLVSMLGVSLDTRSKTCPTAGQGGGEGSVRTGGQLTSLHRDLPAQTLQRPGLAKA